MFPYPTQATGQQLDSVAHNLGVVRRPGETDEELRKRTRNFVQGMSNTAHFPFEMPELELESVGILPIKSCECGQHKFGFTEPGSAHSDWCPLFVYDISR